MYRHTKLLFLTIALVASSTVAYAANGYLEDDAVAIAAAKIPLIQAVTIAEQHASGKAIHAEYEKSKQGGIYEVEVVSTAKVFDVRIDADKGMVISSTESKEVHNSEHD